MPRCASRCAPRSSNCTQEMQTTFVYVTHDQAEALTLADRIVVMQRRRGPADRHAGRHLRAAAQHVRRVVPRQSADQFPAGRLDRGDGAHGVPRGAACAHVAGRHGAAGGRAAKAARWSWAFVPRTFRKARRGAGRRRRRRAGSFGAAGRLGPVLRDGSRGHATVFPRSARKCTTGRATTSTLGVEPNRLHLFDKQTDPKPGLALRTRA